MNRFLIKCTTNWCGMDETFAAYANIKEELETVAQQCAYDNFESYDCVTYIVDELYPDAEEITDEMYEEAGKVEGKYYDYSIEEFDEDEENWEWYDLVYDGRNKNPIV